MSNHGVTVKDLKQGIEESLLKDSLTMALLEVIQESEVEQLVLTLIRDLVLLNTASLLELTLNAATVQATSLPILASSLSNPCTTVPTTKSSVKEWNANVCTNIVRFIALNVIQQLATKSESQ